MKTHLLLIAVFIAGVGIGWLGKSWFVTGSSDSTTTIAAVNQNTDTRNIGVPENLQQQSTPAITVSNKTRTNTTTSVTASAATANAVTVNANTANADTANAPGGNSSQGQQPLTGYISNNASVAEMFKRLLSSQRYTDAMVLFQEQGDAQTVAQLKRIVVDQLKLLTESRNNSDFSELIGSYLSIYYDDIDILLLLADFNHKNSSYLEVVDVYLLAKTYAYTDFDQKRVDARFNDFVAEIDGSYTNQKNWASLTNFYSHINTSGLMNSGHQYLQALAHLRSGDQVFAVDLLNELLSDSLVGESAALALNNLASHTEVPPATTNSEVWEDSIALEKEGNQFLVNLTNNRESSVKLLIDTGASMTALSQAGFDSLNTFGDALEQETRVFRTAGGLITGTVFNFPELRLGPYLMENIKIALIDFDAHRDVGGLLGMNILGKFRFQIDQENERLLLSRE